MKSLTKKLFIIVLTLSITLLCLLPINLNNNNKTNQNTTVKASSFTNEFFNTTIPSFSGESEELVPFKEINEIIFNGMNNDSYANNTERDNAMKNQISTLVGNKRVAITDAEDLYDFSISASYNWQSAANHEVQPCYETIKLILDLDYVIVNDIDYSVMKAKQFVPIGLDFTTPDETIYYPFTGTFDGNGFTIKNLYLADYDYITFKYRADADDESTELDITLSQYYAMFANIGTDATVCNVQIVDPIFELLDVPDGLTKTAIFAGENKGLIYNIAVIDEKINARGEDTSGISWSLPYGSVQTTTFTAAGLVHTNDANGRLYNSYYSAKRVVQSSSDYLFKTKPVVYNEAGYINGISYNSDVNANVDEFNTTNNIEALTKNEILNGTDVNINDVQINNESRKWYFFEYDGYPSIHGLIYDNEKNAFLIKTDLDLIIFSRILSKQTPFNGIGYASHNYSIENDIDMTNFPYTPSKEEFKGSLIGGNDLLNDSQNDNIVIKNLSITVPYNTETEMYYGLFSTLSGTVTNINFDNCKIELVQDNNVATKTSYVGFVAGKTNNATIQNIITNSIISMGTNAVGNLYAGSLVGYGNGNISYVANLGNINGNANHDFANASINPIYQIGGILGGSSENGLTLFNALNKGNIETLGTTTTFNSPNIVEISVGGIVGSLNNNNENTNNKVYYVTNEGTITANKFAGTATNKAYIYAAGIIGNVKGKSGPLNEGTKVVNGRYENKGTIKNYYTNTHTYCYNAGILNASTSVYSEFSYMINTGNSNLKTEIGMDSSNNNVNVYYAATVVDNSTAGLTVSRAYNEADYEFSSSYFINNSNEALIGPFFASVNNAKSKLLYCENNGNLTVGTTSTITTYSDTKIAGFTQAYNLDYTNVYMTGEIKVFNINQGADLYVSGIAWILPNNPSNLSSVNAAENCINEGLIVTAGISGETKVDDLVGNSSSGSGGSGFYPGGMGSSTNNFSATVTSHNLYVAGLFNLNVGIISNSMNGADILSEYSGYNQITGTCNTYVGGLVTINYYIIQDCANSGHINYTNTSSGNIYIAGGENPSATGLFGGIVFAYNGGLTLGGVCAALADRQALILQGTDYGYLAGQKSQAVIKDTSNNGNVFGKARQYVRCGGVLAVALGVELTAGTDNTSSENATQRKFSYCEVGSGDSIATAELSNGLNFGNITSITDGWGNITGQQNRPGIYSCSGGVIGYGLCVMIRMINHGVISSCDTAGGIIGATYILGTPSGQVNTSLNVTDVNINTAVHYGKVKALKYSQYSNMSYKVINDEIDNQTYSTTYFYPDNSTSIYPSNNTAINQGAKRGFGGIFGRLQRGSQGLMQSSQFVNIINMDENVDMIGRVDQYNLNSTYYFKFGQVDSEGNYIPDTYYSARTNDTTAAYVIGYINGQTRTIRTIDSATSITLTITRTRNQYGNGYTYTVTGVDVRGGSGTTYSTYTRRVPIYLGTGNITNNQAQNGFENIDIIEDLVEYSNYTQEFTPRDTSLNSFNLTTQEASSAFNNAGNGTTTATLTYDLSAKGPLNVVTNTSGNTNSQNPYQMEIVTDDPTETDYTYIFNEDFPLMDPEQSNYIYAADNAVLADRFRLPSSTNYKPNGMYVLASTLGRDKGAVLPANFKVNHLFKLNETGNEFIDLNNVDGDEVIHDESKNAELLYDYQSMFQIRLSDKSLIMEDQNDSEIYDIVLYDPNGNAPTLTNGKVGVDEDGKPTITFTISASALNNSSVTYYVKNAELSENAVIAKSGIKEADFAGFGQAYQNRTSNILTGDYASIINGTLTSGTTTTFTDKVTVYSEIASSVASLVETYYTDYTIIIECVSTTLNIGLETSQMDNVTVANPTLNNYTYDFGTTNSISPSGTLNLTFVENSNVLPAGHELTFVNLKYNNVEVDTKYYSYLLTGKNDASQLGMSITLSDELKSGVYTLEYKYYSNKDSYFVVFNKASSGEFTILDVNYQSYSYSSDVNDLTFVAVENDFSTYIGFGVLLPGLEYLSSKELTIQKIVKSGESYINTIDYFEIRLDGELINTIKLAPFAELTSATVLYDYDDNGNREQIFTYQIKGENGNTVTIEHTIKERDLNDVVIYKDGIVQLTQPIYVLRESILTQISIDFGFSDATENNNVTTIVKNNDTIVNLTEDEVYYSAARYYVVNVTNQLGVSDFIYTFNLQREANVNKQLISVVIEKLEGTSAYLQDINFQAGSDSNLVYPTIYTSDANGNEVVTDYDVRVYYAGIDYDGADENNVKHFRIDGKVADIDIENYHPTFTLPIGATIKRFIGKLGTDNLEDDSNYTTELNANFIGEDEEQDCIITYKVTSEDGNNVVYYHITTTDILYNLTLRFTIYYRDSNGTIVEAGDANSPIKDNVIVITVKNYSLSLTVDELNQQIDTENGIKYPFVPGENEKGISEYITGTINQTTMFYKPVTLSNYLYTFGRNLSGCYGFSVVTPIYEDDTDDSKGLVKGERYKYNIYFKDSSDSNNSWAKDANLLSNLDNTGIYDGKYFFIGNSTRNRIRNFAIVIEEQTGSADWGLTDDSTTWH